MHLRIFIILCIVQVTQATLRPSQVDAQHIHDWLEWKYKNNKNYDSAAEELTRFYIWQENRQKIEEHNNQYVFGVTSHRLAINEFADISNEEFQARLSIPKPSNHKPLNTTVKVSNFLVVPSSIDWRNYGLVTRVKNQGSCGSCWAFSAVGSFEGQYYKTYKKLRTFSEQQLIDCNTMDYGCEGGIQQRAFDDMLTNDRLKHLEDENDYPYREVKNHCRISPQHGRHILRGYQSVDPDNETEMLWLTGLVGPVAASLDATGLDFQFYKDGVYKNRQCSPDKISHGVVVIGYGTNAKDGDYWIVKNSWGPGWGEDGFFKIARGSNMCGIARQSSIAIL